MNPARIAHVVVLALLTSVSLGIASGRLPHSRVDSSCDPPPPQPITCGPGECDLLEIDGDPYAATPGTFKGYSDPHLIADPEVGDRIWLTYSWLETQLLTDPDDQLVWVAVVVNNLARSDDGGETFQFVTRLWDSIPTPDPEGEDGDGLIDSEVGSLAWIEDPAGTITWYGAHIRYFLPPVAGYHPEFSTSYTIRVTAAPSPEELAGSPEAVLGVSSTAPVYQPDLALDQLVGRPFQDCAMANNPTLFAQEQTLYLAFECLSFLGPAFRPNRSTVQLIATEPDGDPSTWNWRHAGILADGATFAELGADYLQQPDLALGSRNEILLTLTPARENPDGLENIHEGLRVLELDSLEPPTLVRDCRAELLVHAAMDTEGVGGCGYSAESATGLMCHSVQTGTEPRHLHVTRTHPTGLVFGDGFETGNTNRWNATIGES